LHKTAPPLRIMDIDATGARFGRLTAQRSVGGPMHRWLCLCDCGNTTTPPIYALLKGTRSCGCLTADSSRQRQTRHGHCRSPEYRTWRGIIRRCHNENSADYLNYGGRGIEVCAEWRHNFPAFFRDVGKRPSAAHSLDRIDNSGGYCKGNCRWALRRTQNNNRRNTRMLTAFGICQPLAEWARQCDIPYIVLWRQSRYNWKPERVVRSWSPWGEAFDASRF
jgi:hypothetical protein